MEGIQLPLPEEQFRLLKTNRVLANPKALKDRLIVAAIDFGTTYSSWAFSFKHEFDADPTRCSTKHWPCGRMVLPKAPTSVLIKSDGQTVDCFGFEADRKYSEEADNGNHKQWYYFRRFKMMLFGEIGVKKTITMEGPNGRKLSALRVFSLCIGFLKDNLINEAQNRIADFDITTDDIHWVLTVPAIWNDAAKQFMREAAQNAGIKGDYLTIALEPEAASLYCRHVPNAKCFGKENTSLAKFQAGSKYLVLDAGGGTVDITVHEITDTGDIKELHQASGGAWGGIKVDEAFENLLTEIIGKETMEKFRENTESFFDLFSDFEVLKRAITPEKEEKKNLRLPVVLMDLHKEVTGRELTQSIKSTKYADQITLFKEKLKIDAGLLTGLFDETINSIVSHVNDLLRLPSVSGCTTILLVGGFSESTLLQDKIRKSFQQMKIIVPIEASLTVLKGAVLFGHSPKAITERVCKYTYGIAESHEYKDCGHPSTRMFQDNTGKWYCGGLFSVHAKIGQSVKFGDAQPEITYIHINDDETNMTINIYASPEEDIPFLTTEPGCRKIGSAKVPMVHPEGTKRADRKVGVTFIFGGTEIEVKIEDKITGKIMKKCVDCLG